MKRPSLRTSLACAAFLSATAACMAAEDAPLVDKTLVVWVSPANLTQSGGTALTVNDTTIDRFDGVVFAEIEPQVWMPGSNGYSRTNKSQASWPKETVPPDRFVGRKGDVETAVGHAYSSVEPCGKGRHSTAGRGG